MAEKKVIDLSDVPVLEVRLPDGTTKEWAADDFLYKLDRAGINLKEMGDSKLDIITDAVEAEVGCKVGPIYAMKIYKELLSLVNEAQKKTEWLQDFSTTTQDSASQKQEALAQ